MNEIERCRPWIEAALVHANGTHIWADIVAMIETGRVQLWPAPDGCIVSEVVEYPRKRVLNVFLGGGSLEQLADMHGDVIAWAKVQGCTAATIQGRKGWERAFKPYGWQHTHTTLTKDFEP